MEAEEIANEENLFRERQNFFYTYVKLLALQKDDYVAKIDFVWQEVLCHMKQCERSWFCCFCCM